MLKNPFKSRSRKPSGFLPNPSPPPATSDPLVQNPCAAVSSSSGCPSTSEQQPAPPIRVTAPPAGDAGSQDCLRPMSTSEIRKRTYAALARRLTSEELRGVRWERSVGSTAGIIENLKTTLRDNNQQSKTTNNILQHINKYCAIVDIAIQHHPDITALVWARVRTLIQVSRTLNNVILEGRTHSLPSWQPITMKPS